MPPVIGSLDRAEARGGELVSACDAAGAPGEVDDCRAHLLERERGAATLEEGSYVRALPGGVRSDGGRPQVGNRGQVREQ